MALPQIPPDIINRSLDALGAGTVIGALTDGTAVSEAARRSYGQTLRQLLRGAHWNFARKRAPLMLLADATGQTLAPNGQAISQAVEQPWTYCYAWPNDGVAARWLPWNATNAPAAPPATTAGNPVLGAPSMPARFLISSSDQFPALVGEVDWDNLPDLGEGQGLVGRRVVLTDVPQAELVYTKLTLDIGEWDELFSEAMVALLASRLALAAIPERKAAMAERAVQITLAKSALTAARVATANDSGFPLTTDHTPDWIRYRNNGYDGRWGGLGGPGAAWYGWDQMVFADGSVM